LTTVELRVHNFQAKAAELRAASRRLQMRVVKAADRAVQTSLLPALKSTAPEFVPSGYQPTLVAGLKVETLVSFAGASPGVDARITAPTGGPKGRDIARLERGQLKHPLFGDKSRWYTTRFKPRFAKTALVSTRPKIVKEIDDELDEIARELR
jgi:hypothetical protein